MVSIAILVILVFDYIIIVSGMLGEATEDMERPIRRVVWLAVLFIALFNPFVWIHIYFSEENNEDVPF